MQRAFEEIAEEPDIAYLIMVDQRGNIFGLPGETENDWLGLADELNRLPVKFVKLHHLHVVKGSILAKQYRENPFELFSLKGYGQFLGRFLARLSPDIVVQRLFGLADLEDLIAPDWGLKKTLIQLLWRMVLRY